MILRRHPLRRLEQELRAHRHSVQLPLSRLDAECVRRWLDGLCPSPPAALVKWLHGRTEGQPLFLVTLLEALVAAGLVTWDHGDWSLHPGYADFGVPESLRLMIDRQVDRLDPADRLLLEAASAVGPRFSAASVAAAVQQDLVAVEQRCTALAREGAFVRRADPFEWPDGTVAGAYQFTHELYRNALYDSLAPAHRRRLHQRIGERLQRLVQLAELLPFPHMTLIAHACGAWSCWSRGELAAAREHAVRAIGAKPTESASLFPSTLDIVSYAFGTAAFVDMALGDLGVARARAEEAVAWSGTGARPVDRATSLALAAMFYAFIDDPATAADRAQAAIAVADEHGFRQWRAIGRIVAAWAAAGAESGATARAEVIRRIDEYAQMGLRAQLSAFLCLAAGLHIRSGDREIGLELLDRAAAHVRDTGEGWYEAELHRLRGEVVQPRDPRQAEAHFQRAVDVARAQGGRLWELRASVCLAMLWRRHERAAARQLLEPIVSSLADDLDAPDLRVARTLRAALR